MPSVVASASVAPATQKPSASLVCERLVADPLLQAKCKLLPDNNGGAFITKSGLKGRLLVLASDDEFQAALRVEGRQDGGPLLLSSKARIVIRVDDGSPAEQKAIDQIVQQF